MSRGERRAAVARKKAKMKRIIKETWYPPSRSSCLKSKKFIGKMAATPHPCSCLCCGNPRRHYKGKGKLTMQELRANQKDD